MPEPKSKMVPEPDKFKSNLTGSEKYLLNTLNKVTLSVEIIPIVYSILLIALIVWGGFMSQGCAFTIETLAYVTLPFSFICLLLSCIIKLCTWYRVHALVMLLPLAIPISRHFFPDFNIWWVILIAGVPLLTTTLICMYRFNAWSKCKDIFHIFIQSANQPKQTITNN